MDADVSPHFVESIAGNTVEKLLTLWEKLVETHIRDASNLEAQTLISISNTLPWNLENYNLSTICTLPKLKTGIRSLKTNITAVFKSNIVYEIECPGYDLSFFDRTARHLTSCITDYRRSFIDVGVHFHSRDKAITNSELEIIDKSNNSNKLLTLKKLQSNKMQLRIIAKEEYGTREVTLRVWLSNLKVTIHLLGLIFNLNLYFDVLSTSVWSFPFSDCEDGF